MKQIDFEALLTEQVDDRRIQQVHSRLMRKFEDKVRGLKNASEFF